MSKTTEKVLCFDYGTKKIGVAFGQSITQSASALPALSCVQQKVNWDAIEQLIKEWQPTLLLVGLPFNMDGSESPMSLRALKFSRQLFGRFHLPVKTIDERLSTREARERIGKPALTGRDARVDSVAACIMIENYFNTESESRELE